MLLKIIFVCRYHLVWAHFVPVHAVLLSMHVSLGSQSLTERLEKLQTTRNLVASIRTLVLDVVALKSLLPRQSEYFFPRNDSFTYSNAVGEWCQSMKVTCCQGRIPDLRSR